MKIVISKAGAGKRFSDKGYKEQKPAIPTIDRYTGELYPMVVCATRDLRQADDDGDNIIYIDRKSEENDITVVERKIQEFYPRAGFITVDHVTEGQACTCLLAKDRINNDEELLIAGCDNGMDYSLDKFNDLREETDVIVFTYRNNESVCENPNQYGWVKVDNDNNITGLSIKKAISNEPKKDHAIVSTFWFKKGSIFVEASEKMIAENDRINNEFYVDQAIKHVLDLGYSAKVFEIDRYVGWGTPTDFENYQNTIKYWKDFWIEEDEREEK